MSASHLHNNAILYIFNSYSQFKVNGLLNAYRYLFPKTLKIKKTTKNMLFRHIFDWNRKSIHIYMEKLLYLPIMWCVIIDYYYMATQNIELFMHNIFFKMCIDYNNDFIYWKHKYLFSLLHWVPLYATNIGIMLNSIFSLHTNKTLGALVKRIIYYGPIKSNWNFVWSFKIIMCFCHLHTFYMQ